MPVPVFAVIPKPALCFSRFACKIQMPGKDGEATREPARSMCVCVCVCVFPLLLFFSFESTILVGFMGKPRGNTALFGVPSF